jgi:hypothetical protein
MGHNDMFDCCHGVLFQIMVVSGKLPISALIMTGALPRQALVRAETSWQ